MQLPIAPLSAQRIDTLDLLPAIFIPTIDYGPQNGLNHYDLFDNDKPVILTIVTGNKYKKDTIINLYWDNNLIVTRILNEDDIKNTTIGISVLPVAISAPLGVVYYTAFHPLTDELETSESRTVLVNTLIPGDPDPDNTTPTINENLTKPEGIPDVIDADAAANGIEVTVAPWLHMEAGDVLTLYWGGTQQRVQNLPLPEDQLGKPQLIFADKDTIAAAGDRKDLIVNYDIRDSVNNWSLKSLPALTNVDIGANTLAAPRVLDAQAGVIDLATLGTAAVRVQLPAYIGIAEGDDITLHWQGETPAGVPVVPFTLMKNLSADDVAFPPIMEVPNSFATAIAGGRATVSYDVNTAGNVRNSRKVSVGINGVAAQLLPPTIEGTIGNQLDLSLIPEQGATVNIPAYMGMDFGDQVLMTWRGRTQQGQDLVHTAYASIAREDIGQPVTFTVTKSYAALLENSLLMLSYSVIFYSGSIQDSPIVEFQVTAGGSASLPAPTVDNAPGNVFDPDAHDGTTVRMSNGLLREDEATMFWGIPGQPGAVSKEFRIAANNQPIQWAITAEQVEANRDQVVSVYYQVKRANQRLNSPVLPLSIKSGTVVPAPSLPKPAVEGTQNDVLDPVLVGRYAFVLVDYDDELLDDVVTVEWQGANTGSYSTPPQSPVAQGHALRFEVPHNRVEANRGTEVRVSYTCVRKGALYESAAYGVEIKATTAALTIDTSDMQLNGRILRYDRVPTNPPANSHATRVASGGVPPYSYSATDPTRVDVNPKSGQVIAHKNGTTSVIVTDSAGATANYKVNVSNALRLDATNDLQGYKAAVTKAQANGGHLPTIAEFKEFCATYGGQPNTTYGDLETWSTDKGWAGINRSKEDAEFDELPATGDEQPNTDANTRSLFLKATIVLNSGLIRSESELTGSLAWSTVSVAN